MTPRHFSAGDLASRADCGACFVMAASPKPTPTPIDNPLHILPETELARFHELTAKLENLRLSIQGLKGQVVFHQAESVELGSSNTTGIGNSPAPRSNPMLRRSGVIGIEEARDLVQTDLENAKRELDRSIAEQEIAQREVAELQSKLTRIAKDYLRARQTELFADAERVALKSQTIDEFEAACTRLGIHLGADYTDPAYYGGFSYFRPDGVIDGHGRRRLGSGKSPFQREVARKLAR